jgi:hypothetical protein
MIERLKAWGECQTEQSRRNYLLFARKEVIQMNSNVTRYYSYRIRLEKLKQKTWTLIVIARLLFFLAILVVHYLKQS